MSATPPPAILDDAAVDVLRARTPGVRTTVHFNHAGASLPSAGTLEAMRAQMWREAEMGPIEAGAAARDQAEQARVLGAALLNARPGEIAITAGNSVGWAGAFAALGNWRPGDRILVARQEWGGNIAAMHLAAVRAGARIETIPCDDSGMADPRALETMMDDRVRLVSVTWLPANGGLINPVAAIGAVARRHGVPYFVDAAQAVGQLPIDVQAIGCDVLAGVGRKALRGPRQTGLLYVRQDFLPRLTPALVDTSSAPLDGQGLPVLREDAERFEPSERSYVLRCGLANALREALDIGIPAIRARIDRNAGALRALLADIPGVAVLDQGRERSGLVSFAVAGIEASALARALAAQGISIGANGPAYTPLDMRARGLAEIARASVSYLTADAEMDRLAEAIRVLARRT
ncbi:aminotransferase class V-fold PLP-dependent enzyme [Bordetella bronchialis]|uniref:Class V aminotransferase n=1 Tax=Bordetella bronchialis TaxID=463025 RepID=A0A193FUH7_9BORD|nr:aminotransferase class V-fold PLP-dependent enzyme [Bordetella bronchialis]ANN70699.1 class V aminotransferase [Bordetella bronchialis]